MIKFVNAKLNLGLNIIRKRDDGYHELQTLFYPVGLYNGSPVNPEPFCDILEIHLSDSGQEDELSFSGNPIDCPPEKNLVYKAVGVFRTAMLRKGYSLPGCKIRLDKHIPDGAGLGGGSADASFTLLALNELRSDVFSKKELIEMALSLGADCPFFIENSPVIAEGIGEIMSPCELNLTGNWAVIVKPDVHVSTKEAFSGITPRTPDRNIPDIIRHPVSEWETEGLKNDFEDHIFQLYPQLRSIKDSLAAKGALYSSMSGSGSAIFGIYPGRESALNAYSLMRKELNETCGCFISKL